MDKKKNIRVPLNIKNLQKAVENLADLSDLSDNDSEGDPCYADSINSPYDSCLNQPDDNLIEQRLEQIFGLEDNYNNDSIEDEPIPTTESLFNVLCQSPNNQNTIDTTTSMTLDSEQDIYHSQLQVQELCSEEQDSQSSHTQQEPVDIPDDFSSIPLFEQVVATDRQDNYYRDGISIDELLENDQQESQDHNEILRDPSHPREWKTAHISHDVPVFEKRFKPKA